MKGAITAEMVDRAIQEVKNREVQHVPGILSYSNYRRLEKLLKKKRLTINEELELNILKHLAEGYWR